MELDFDNLVDVIYQKLQEKLAELDSRPALLLLSEKKDSEFREMLLNCEELKRSYRMICWDSQDSKHDLSRYEAVVICDLSCSVTGRVSAGVLDCRYTRLLGQAILEQRKIYVLTEGVELFQYRQTAPPAYYTRLRRNLKLLEDCGFKIVSVKELAARIGGSEEVKTEVSKQTQEMQSSCASENEKQKKSSGTVRPLLNKRVITEKDMSRLPEQTAEIEIGEKSLITALAQDYAKKHRISVIRAGDPEEQVV